MTTGTKNGGRSIGPLKNLHKILYSLLDLVARSAEALTRTIGSVGNGIRDRPVQPPNPSGQDRADLLGAKRHHKVKA